MMSCIAKAVLIIAFLLAVVPSAFPQNSSPATVTLAWDPSPDPSVVGYRLYYGIASLTYTNFVEVDQGTTVTISNLTGGLVYYFAATTVDVTGLESDFSTEVAYAVGALPCTIVVTDVIQPYDGTSKSISVTTVPAGLPVTVSYAGLQGPPSAVGQYPFTAAFASATCNGQTSGILTINPGVATVGLSNLDQIYDGTPKPVQASTAPQGLAVNVTYNGQTNPPSQAGAYVVVATVVDQNYSGSATGTLIVEPATAQILLDDLTQTYTGNPLGVFASTVPTGLSLLVTYGPAGLGGANGPPNGAMDLPTEAGTYLVSASVQDPNYVGNANAVFVINPAQVSVQLSALNQVYDGTAKAVSVSTQPPNLPVVISYNNQSTPPANAGIYQVSAYVQANDYAGSAVGSLTVLPASAQVTLLNLSQISDGTPKSVAAITQPPGLSVLLTYDGVTQAPSAPGTYSVIGYIVDPNYSGSASGTLTLSGSANSTPSLPISLNSFPPNGAAPNVPNLLLTWPTNATGVTIWQSTDLLTWTSLTNMPGNCSSLLIVSQPATCFFRATAALSPGSSQIPLLFGKP